MLSAISLARANSDVVNNSLVSLPCLLDPIIFICPCIGSYLLVRSICTDQYILKPGQGPIARVRRLIHILRTHIMDEIYRTLWYLAVSSSHVLFMGKSN